MRPIWKLEKDTTHGTSWRLTVGIPGAPNTFEVSGLSREQAENLGPAMEKVEAVAKYRALENVRNAIGVSNL